MRLEAPARGDYVKTVTMFEASDGKIFKDREAASEYEAELKAVEHLVRLILPSRLDTTNFTNGHGYIQLKKSQVDSITQLYIDLIEQYHPSYLDNATTAPRGMVGRYLDDSNAPLYRMWYILNCIDSKFRLWGQIYYANNPKAGDQIELK